MVSSPGAVEASHVLALCKPPQSQAKHDRVSLSLPCTWTSTCCNLMFHGLSRSAMTPIRYIHSVHLRNGRIIRLDAETVASFALFHAKSHVELLSESSIARGYHAAISRANTEQQESRHRTSEWQT
jgi:hypothetical protein